MTNTQVTAAQLSAGQTLFTTGANERAVIKDINVVGAPLDLAFSINGTQVVATKAKATGVEIMDTSSALTVQAAATPLINKELFVNSNNGYEMTYGTNYISAEGVAVLPASSAQTLIAHPASGVGPTMICFGANGDFYYFNPNNNTLYRRAGGLTGTLSTVVSAVYLTKYDGSRYIFCFNQSNWYVVDTTTGTLATYTISEGVGASYSFAGAVNGYCLVAHASAYNGTTGYVYKADGNKWNWSNISDASGSGQRYFGALLKKTNGDYVFLHSNYTTPYWLAYNLGSNLEKSGTATGITAPTLSPSNYAGQANMFIQLPMANYAAYADSTKTLLYDADANAFTTVISGRPLNSYSPSYGSTVYLDQTLFSQQFGTPTIRVTGVLSA